MGQHETATVTDAKRKALLGRNIMIWITALFVTECERKKVRLSLCLTAAKLFDCIKIGLAKANNAIVTVVCFSTKIRELDHYGSCLFFSSLSRLLNHLTTFGQAFYAQRMNRRKQVSLIESHLNRRKSMEPGVDLFDTGQIIRAKSIPYSLRVLRKEFSLEIGDHAFLSVPFVQ